MLALPPLPSRPSPFHSRGHAHPRLTNLATMLRNFVKGPGFLGGSGTCSAEPVGVGDARGSAAGLGFGGVGAGFGFGGGGAGLGPFFLPLLSSTPAEIVPVLPAEKPITLAPKVFTATAAASGPPNCCTITPHATASRASTARARAVNESFGRRFVTAMGGTGDPTGTLLEPTSLMGALFAPFKCVVPRDGEGEASGAIGGGFLGLRFDGEELFCCEGLRRTGEVACRGGIWSSTGAVWGGGRSAQIAGFGKMRFSRFAARERPMDCAERANGFSCTSVWFAGRSGVVGVNVNGPPGKHTWQARAAKTMTTRRC